MTRSWNSNRFSQSVFITNTASGTALIISNTFSPRTRCTLFSATGRNGSAASVEPASFVDFAETIVGIGHAGAASATTTNGRGIACPRPALLLAARPVTNGEYLDFIEAGGYNRPENWLSLGWTTFNEQQLGRRRSTGRSGTGFGGDFTLWGRRPGDQSEPVTHVNGF